MMEYVFVDDLHRYKRLKVTRACESCRRRKVKCDGGSGGTQTPCSSCRKLKIECIFSNMALKRAPPKSEAEQMDERLQRVENLLHKLDEDDANNGKRDYTGRANYIYAEEGKLLKAGESKPEMGEMLILTEPPLPFTHCPSNAGPTPELAAHLVQLYFKHVHPYIPILHKADFLRRLNDKSNPISPLLLYAVFATAARFSDDPSVRQDVMKPETAGYPYYNRAKDLLDDFLDTPRLSTVQAQILILKFQEGIHRPGFFFRSWLYFGMIIRMAQDLGLNKNFSKWNLQISREDLIARKRVWQICFLCDQFMSGRDIAISLSNTDIDLPLKEDYEDEEEFQIQTDFVHMVRLTKILASVMSVISPAGSGSTLQSWSSNPKLTTLDAALDAWNLALPPRLQCVPAFEANGSLSRPPTSHFAGFLNILYHTVLILLHRPYITSLDTSKVSSPNHVNICTVAANSISQIAQSMFETWGPLVFQYPVRGGNYGVYCLVAASMIHLVNMTSPDLRYSRPAHDHLMRTLRILRVCVEHSAAWELRDRVQALEAAFSAQQARQPVVIFQPGSNPPTPTPSMQGSPYSKARRPQNKRRFATQNNTVGTNLPNDNGQHMLSNSFPNTFSNIQHPVATAPQFQDRPLYLLSEDLSCEPQSFLDPSNPDHAATMANPFEYINNGSMDDNSMLGSSLQMELNGSVDQTSYWDNNNLLVWNQLSNPQAHVWPGSGGISPVSLSTSPSAPPSTGQQTPNHSGSSPSLEQINYVNGNNNTTTGAISPSSSPASPPPQITPGVIDPVIVASQNHGELMLYSEYS